MKYLCLVHLDEARIAAESKDVWAHVGTDSYEYDQALMRSGHFIAAAALQAPNTAVIVRPKGSDFSTTDGPFVEVKEHLGALSSSKPATSTRRSASRQRSRLPNMARSRSGRSWSSRP